MVPTLYSHELTQFVSYCFSEITDSPTRAKVIITLNNILVVFDLITDKQTCSYVYRL